MRRPHIALGVSSIEASVQDYSMRLRAAPTVVVPDEYALWRTDALNFSIRKVAKSEVGMLRHLGWEDPSSEAFTSNKDVNGIVWEQFSAAQQLEEIRSLWNVAPPPARGGSSAPARPALLIIDVQRAIDHPSWGRRNNPDAELRIRDLLVRWRQRAWPIIHVRHHSLEPDSTYRLGQDGCEFKPEVRPEPGEKVVTKHTNSAFIGTELGHWLRTNHIRTLVVCGVITNNSVESTVRMAGNLGYRTFLISDATATFDKLDLEGQLHTAEEVHALSLANIQDEYAQVVTSAALLRELDRLSTDQTMSLEEVRANIDRVDLEIITLLAERAQYVK